MYTIDLLRGEGIPIRSRPGGIAFACLLVAFPLLATIGIVSFYLDCDVILTIQRQELRKLDAGLEALSEAVKRREMLERNKTEAVAVLSDVKTALQEYTQWSTVLAEVVENISDALVLTQLDTRQETHRRKVPAKDDPARRIDVSFPVRTLRIRVCGREKEVSYDAVKDLQERLRSSGHIGPRLDAITVSQEAGRLDGAEAVLYELQCTFKPMIP
jgi:hypothetical protein